MAQDALTPDPVLLAAAREAQSRARATYSDFKVGCAVRTKSGVIQLGCNVEIISYGLTNCAERVALQALIANGGDTSTIEEVVVVGPEETDCSPCGACRQVLLELAPAAHVWFKAAGAWTKMSTTDLLPHGYYSDLVRRTNPQG